MPILLCLSACGGGPAGGDFRLDPLVVDRERPTALQPVSFLSGCWRGRSASGSTVIEERYTPPSANVILGTTRYLRDGRTVGWEFTHVEVVEGEVILTPYPGGDRSPHAFRLTRSSDGEVVFEAPEHDYPERIVYRVLPDGRLGARIDAGSDDPEPRTWTLERVSCEALPGM